MICKTCGSEFKIDNFDLCPNCLTPVEVEPVSVKNVVQLENIEDGQSVSITITQIGISNNDDEAIIEDTDYLQQNMPTLCEGDSADSCSNCELQYDLPIEKLCLSQRAYNVLKRNAINTIGDLINYIAENDLRKLRNAGAKTVDEIQRAIKNNHPADDYNNDNGIDIHENITEDFPFINMSCDVENLSIMAISELGMSPQTVHIMQRQGWRVCGDLKLKSTSDIIGVIRKNNIEKMLHVANLLENDIITLLQKVLDETAGERDGMIFIRRSQGDTLQNIADNPSTGDGDTLTRERVRQIEKKYGSRIIPFVIVLVEILRGNDNFVLVQDIMDLYENDDYDRILFHACKMIQEYSYFDFADMLVKNDDGSDMESRLMQALGEYIGEGLDIGDDIDELYSLLSEIGFGYLDIHAVKNLLRKYGYKIYGDYAAKGKVSYGVLCIEIIKKHFPMGIKLSQSETEQTENLIRLRELVKEKYVGVELPDSDRALSSTLVRCGMILRGRGIYIPEDCIEIDENVLCEIKKSIDSKPDDRVFYGELYSEFEGVLNFTCGIDNYNYLHGVLMKYYPIEYEYGRDYLLKNGTTESQAGTVADRIYEYICEMGRPITKKELMNRFQGFSNVMLIMPFVNDNRLLQWEYNQFSCMGILNISQDDKSVLHTMLFDVLNQNNGYASDAMLYKYVKSKYQIFIEKNNITSDMNLYYIVSKLFGDACDFRRPHIGVKGKFEKFSTKDIILHMLNYPDEISYEHYRLVAEKMAWSPVTIGMVFTEIEKDYVRTSTDKYVKSESFWIAQDVIADIRERIELQMEDGVLPLTGIDMDELPEIEYEWNEFLLESVIKMYCHSIEIIHPAIKDRRYQKGIAVLKETNIKSYPEVVAHMMKRFEIDSISERQFLSFLVVHNLTQKMIPNELSNSDYVKRVGDSYVRVC